MKLYFLPPLILQKLIWIPTRLIFLFFGHIQIRGLGNLKEIRNTVIFASNHSSEMDPILIPASLPFSSRFSPIFYTARERSFYKRSGWRKYLLGGTFIKGWGAYPVHTGLNDYEKSLVEIMPIASTGGCFCVFPEGSITRTGVIQPAKGGVAYMAEKLNYAIVPVAISGAYKTRLLDFLLRRKRIVVNFGTPITQEELWSKVPRNSDTDMQVYKNRAQYVIDKIKNLGEKV